ncbi:LPIN3 phosphatase, partial [Tricholaema leucomelas]|nr:LPIN3 phosphatase [Tricholaema leucomelas]
MNYVGQLAETVFVTVKELYRGLNPATLTGCIDVVVVRQPDNSFQCSPFHVRFGKLGVLRSREKVVDIEINGEPVDLHMKLGDNGEAFFVQESDENEGSIPSRLCTSPIHTDHSPKDAAQSPCGQEISSAEATLRKRRHHRRKPKWKEVPESEFEGCEETQNEVSMEGLCELPAPSVLVVIGKHGAVEQMRSYVAFSSCSPSLSHPSSPKSDSELEIRPLENLALEAESHMQWTWGKLPQTMAAAATSPFATSLLVGEATHLVTTSEGLGKDPSPAEFQDIPSSTVSVVNSTPTSQDGNSLSGLKDIPNPVGAETLLEASAAPQKKQEGGGSVVPEVQPDVETLEGAAVLMQVGSEGPEPQLESQRRQGEWMAGSIKRSLDLGPSDVYLEDLSNLDEEQVTLYFPRYDDTEQSSKSVADPRNPQLPSDLPAETPMDSHPDLMPTIALSLCGGLGGSRQISCGRLRGGGSAVLKSMMCSRGMTQSLSPEKFLEHVVSYQQFAENPGLVDDPNLVILVNKKYYNWAVAAPMILSLQAFQKNIPESTIDQLVKEKMPKKGSRWWFSWRRREFPVEEVWDSHGLQGKANTLLPPLLRQEEEKSSSDDEPLHPGDVLDLAAPAQKSQPTYKKSLRLSSEQIERLNLQEGPNEVAFSVTTQYQGTCRCKATIYLWNWDDKVVISDIDGTITRSDALGHILPHLGKDWTHPGIVKLFHKIHLNGYKFLYCSARAIGMAHITKGYLKWVNEQGCCLPKGPILLAPSSLFSAFHREVIEKKPEVFKIACLMDIQNLFATQLPFYAAFGNRSSDVYAYKQVGLPESRIFTINPKGELIQELTKNHKST